MKEYTLPQAGLILITAFVAIAAPVIIEEAKIQNNCRKIRQMNRKKIQAQKRPMKFDAEDVDFEEIP